MQTPLSICTCSRTRAFPDLKILIAQVGHPWVEETLVLLGKHGNIFADISGVASRPWQLYTTLLNATSFRVMDRLLFGSGFPRETPAKAIESLYSVNAYNQGTQLPSIPRAQIRGIVERDSLACLGIEAEIAHRRINEEHAVGAADAAESEESRIGAVPDNGPGRAGDE